MTGAWSKYKVHEETDEDDLPGTAYRAITTNDGIDKRRLNILIISSLSGVNDRPWYAFALLYQLA